MQIAIINSTGSPMGDMVLKGVYGSFTPSEVEGGLAKFKISPEFGRISSVFMDMQDVASPVQPQDVKTIEVEDRLEHLAKAQIMRELAVRWEKMYSRVSPEQPGPMGAMLHAERLRTARGAKEHLVSMGLRAYSVPVIATICVPLAGEAVANETRLKTALAAVAPTQLELDTTEGVDEPLDLGTEPLTKTAVELNADDAQMQIAIADQQAEGREPPPWATYSGIEAKVKAGLIVLATDAASALDAARVCIQLREQLHIPAELDIESVVSTSDMQLESEDDPDFPRDRY